MSCCLVQVNLYQTIIYNAYCKLLEYIYTQLVNDPIIYSWRHIGWRGGTLWNPLPDGKPNWFVIHKYMFSGDFIYKYRLYINRIIFKFNESVTFKQFVLFLYCDGVRNIKYSELQYSNSSDGTSTAFWIYVINFLWWC